MEIGIGIKNVSGDIRFSNVFTTYHPLAMALDDTRGVSTKVDFYFLRRRNSESVRDTAKFTTRKVSANTAAARCVASCIFEAY